MSKPASILLVVLTLTCWFYAVKLYLQATEDLRPSLADPAQLSGSLPPPRWSTRTSKTDQGPNLDNSPSNVFTFIHISDIHVSRFHRVGGRAHLAYFLRHTLPRHGPAFVVATGDLTDSKDEAQVGGRQDEGEWKAYHTILKKAGVLDRRDGRFWRDLRGNHDCFSVPTWSSPANHFARYSASGKAAWADVEDLGFGQYGFIAVDGCPDRGTARMLNFFGLLPRLAMTTLAQQVDEISPLANHTFLLSHYPASTTRYAHAQDGRTFGDLTAKGISLGFCGHLHRLAGGLGDRLQAYHAAGDWLELELPDLKLTSSYRIITVDHDMISYVDRHLFPLDQPLPVNRALEEDEGEEEGSEDSGSEGKDLRLPEIPIVLITNPKEASLILPHKEPTWRIQRSTHIRALVWPGEGREITRVVAHLPGREPMEMTYSGKGSREEWAKGKGEEEYVPLWTLEWNPKDFSPASKPHTLIIHAEDDTGAVGEGRVDFRVDGAREPLDAGWLSHWIINADFDLVLPLAFLSIYLPIMIILLLARFTLPSKDPRGAVALRGRELKVTWASGPPSFSRVIRMAPSVYWHRAQAIACSPKLFLPIFLYGLVLPIAPWYGGDLFTGQGPQKAWVYLVGVWIEGQWVPVLDTWGLGWMSMAWSWAPVVWAIGAGAGARFGQAPWSSWIHGLGAKLWLGTTLAFRGIILLRTAYTLGWWCIPTGPVGLWWWIIEISLAYWSVRQSPGTTLARDDGKAE